MSLLLSHEFHSSLPNAVPCRVEEIKSEGSDHHWPSVPDHSRGGQGCALEATKCYLGPLPGRCPCSPEWHFLDVMRRILSRRHFWTAHSRPHGFHWTTWKYRLLADSGGRADMVLRNPATGAGCLQSQRPQWGGDIPF